MSYDVYVCQTTYHLYQSLILGYRRNNSIVIVLTDFTPGLFDYANRLLDLDFVIEVLLVKNEELEQFVKKSTYIDRLKFAIFYKNRLIGLYLRNYPDLIKKLECAQDNFIFVDESFIGRLVCYLSNRVILLDDGEANYFIQKRGLDYFIKHRVFSIPCGRGVSSSIVTIKYRHPNRVKEPILSEVSNKLECLELSKFEKELSADICEKITKTFSGFDIPVDGRNVIILSQPLSEDNFISEERKIDIYREISEEYIQQGFNVYLKPHPREYTRYEQHLNEVKVFPSLMPSEVLNLQSLNKFDVGVAIQSTALDNASFIIEKIMLGYAKYPDLLSGKEKIDNVVV